MQLQVREARGLKCQADLMNQELMISQQLEYTNKSLPLILHQVNLIIIHCNIWFILEYPV